MIEEWKKVVGYEGLYEVSSIGRVKAVEKITARGHRRRERIMRPGVNSNGYRCVNLWKNVEKKCFKVARLVAQSFLGATSSDVIDHISRDRSDDRMTNLRLTTASGNAKNASLRRDSCTGRKGVRQARYGKYQVRIRVDGVRLHIGMFDDIDAATDAYMRASRLHHGEFGAT